MDFKTVKPEELCDSILIGYLTKLLKNEGAFPEIFASAYENRNANNLVFSVPSDLSITGSRIDVIADRAHLTNGMHGLKSYRQDWTRNRQSTVKPENAIIGWSG